jgi:hypothetical protein
MGGPPDRDQGSVRISRANRRVDDPARAMFHVKRYERMTAPDRRAEFHRVDLVP